MKVVHALLADYAVAHNDRKLYVIGGGIRTLPFPQLPALQQRLSLAVGLEFSETDHTRPHTVRIESIGPGTEPVIKPFDLSIAFPEAVNTEEQGGVYQFVYNMENVTFPVEGEYAFTIAVDGELKHQLGLRVVRTAGPLTAEMESMGRLGEGYAAFSAGDLALAEEIFRDVVERFPTQAHGPNNLGFVLLARGKATEALEQFAKARSLGYDKPEISDANIATALYALGQHANALDLFKRCITQDPFSGPATLFGLGPGGHFPIFLRSAADYVALISLNAAWSARAIGESEDAKRYLLSAQAAVVERKDDSDRTKLRESLSALAAILNG